MCSSVGRASQAQGPARLSRSPTEAPTVLPRPPHHAVTACTLKRLSRRHGQNTPAYWCRKAGSYRNKQAGGKSHQGNGHKQGVKKIRNIKEGRGGGGLFFLACGSRVFTQRVALGAELIVPSGLCSISAARWMCRTSWLELHDFKKKKKKIRLSSNLNPCPATKLAHPAATTPSRIIYEDKWDSEQQRCHIYYCVILFCKG